MSELGWRRRVLALVGLMVLVVTAGCRVDADVDVAVQRNGSGTVAVTVRLDQEAAARVPNLAAQLRTADLTAAGWVITGPTSAPGGGVILVARIRFANPADVGPLLDQVAGAGGPLRGSLTRQHTFGRQRFRFTGGLDLSQGLDAFSDQAFRDRLGGQSLDQILGGAPATPGAPGEVRFTLSLPGSVKGGSRTADHGRLQWKSALGQPAVALRATSDERSSAARLFTIVAAAAAVALVLTVVGALILRRT